MLMCMNCVECAPSRKTNPESYDTVGHSQLNLATKYLPLLFFFLLLFVCFNAVLPRGLKILA